MQRCIQKVIPEKGNSISDISLGSNSETLVFPSNFTWVYHLFSIEMNREKSQIIGKKKIKCGPRCKEMAKMVEHCHILLT